MNLLTTKWLNFSNLNVSYSNNKMIIENTTQDHKFLIYPHVFKTNSESKEIFIKMNGDLIFGTGCTLKILNRHKNILGECGLNSIFANKYELLKYYIIVLYVPAASKIEISKLEYVTKIPDTLAEDFFCNDTLLITPGYPSLENKYNTAFVHTRVQAYKKANINLDVAVINGLPETKIYKFEDIKVFKSNYFELRKILQTKKYKNIIVHFFDNNYANIFDSVDLSETNLYLYLHGADILYRDLPKYASHYFEQELDISYREKEFKSRDYYFKKYNKYPNVTWVFVSDFVKNRAEELLNISFNNYQIIPCYIDNNLFSFKEKKADERKKIFILRKFTNDKCYAIDVDIRAILELSRRPFFKDLEFDIYGDGEMFDILTSPVKDFENVHLNKGFLTHEDIKKIHDSHGIALFASRFDTQGVSLCEAASSGCAVVTSKIPAICSYIDPDLGVTCDVEDYIEYANVIERLYKDSTYFDKVIKSESNSVHKKFNYTNTIQKELNIFKTACNTSLFFEEPDSNPLLTVIIPSYNVEKYLSNGVMSLLNQPYAHKLEILIVNDGSHDSTCEIGKSLQEKTTINEKSIVRIINKENGGHGSTINRGISEARGKYLKVMDGDDTVDSLAFYELLKILENEDTDIILNNYFEDFATLNLLVPKETYPFMIPGIQYKFEDLCYEGYGFSLWGPILSCSTYKTELLKKANFKLSEKCFYVDMELNTYIAIACKTIKYYPLYIYRYFLGRQDQSISKISYMKNYKNHEKVTLNLINILKNNLENISELKKNYITNKLILVMIKTQYIVCIEFYNKGKPFREFEKELKKYPDFYKNSGILTNGLKFHRLTHGYLIRFNSTFIRIKSIFNKILKKLLRK